MEVDENKWRDGLIMWGKIFLGGGAGTIRGDDALGGMEGWD